MSRGFYRAPCLCGALIPKTGKRGRPPSLCASCRSEAPTRARRRRNRSMEHPRNRAEVATWQKLEAAGLAGEVCDAIVRTQPAPVELLRALARP